MLRNSTQHVCLNGRAFTANAVPGFFVVGLVLLAAGSGLSAPKRLIADPLSADGANVLTYRFDTPDYRIEMTVRQFPPYQGGRLSFHNSANPGKELCYSGNGDSSSCVERFVGALAVVTYRFHARRKNLPAVATFREVVKVLAQSEGLDERPPYTREQPLVRGVGSDIQAFGYDESAVAELQRAALRADSRARMWRVYQQDLFLNGDTEPFGVVEWKHTLDRIEVVRATGRSVAYRPF